MPRAGLARCPERRAGRRAGPERGPGLGGARSHALRAAPRHGLGGALFSLHVPAGARCRGSLLEPCCWSRCSRDWSRAACCQGLAPWGLRCQGLAILGSLRRACAGAVPARVWLRAEWATCCLLHEGSLRALSPGRCSHPSTQLDPFCGLGRPGDGRRWRRREMTPAGGSMGPAAARRQRGLVPAGASSRRGERAEGAR